MRGAIVIAVLLLAVSSARACRCPLPDALTRYNRHDFVYTVAVKEAVRTEKKVYYKVVIKGILKQQPSQSIERIGYETIINTGASTAECGIFLTVGDYYVLGGSILPTGENFVSSCDTVDPLRGCALPPCPEGCESWTDGCNQFKCKNSEVLGSSRALCPPFNLERASCKAPEPPQCPGGCRTYFDGCNTCSCGKDGTPTFCTERACLVLEEPKCLQYDTCFRCLVGIDFCPEECKGACKVTEVPSCISCGEIECIRPRRTYFCDPFSVWNKNEQRRCLRKGRSYDQLCCQQEQCCPAEKHLDLGGKRKLKYCAASDGCISYAC